MRRAVRVLALIIVVAALAVPATATAAHYAPPGKAGATQYFETIPTSGGNVAPPSYNPTPRPSSSSSSSPTTASPTLASVGTGSHGSKKLSRMGKSGQAAANFAQATSPVVPAASSTGNGLDKLQANPGGSAVGSLTSMLTGSDAGGIGIFMPLLLGLSLLAALGIGAYRAIRR